GRWMNGFFVTEKLPEEKNKVWCNDSKGGFNMVRKALTVLATALAAAGTLTSTAQAKDSYVIGYFGSLTGFLSSFDNPVLKGIRVAVEDVNAAGGIDGKVPIELKVVDSKSDPAQSAVAAEELLAAGAKLLIGPCSGDIGIPGAQAAQAKGIPVIVTCA